MGRSTHEQEAQIRGRGLPMQRPRPPFFVRPPSIAIFLRGGCSIGVKLLVEYAPRKR